MTFTIWFVIIGLLLIAMALFTSMLKRLPLTSSLLYLGIGFGLGPVGLGLIQLNPIEHSALLERATEVAVMISLFSAGLKLRTPLTHGRWQLPVRLAFGSMLITVGLVTLVGVFLLGLPVGAAVLLGAMLAPTDPVLASDVQVENAWDPDRLRFSLTAEAGLNDGTATPFIMLGLGLLGLHEIGEGGWRWLLVDVGWAVTAGLGIGWILGTLIGYLVIHLRQVHKEAVGLDDFLALGLIALSYGVALLVGGYGFLAVFAAGLALRRIERQSSGETPSQEIMEVTMVGNAEAMATDQEKAPAYMADAVLGFNEQLERIAEIGVVLLLGGMLSLSYFTPQTLWFIPLLFLVIRPLSVGLGLIGSKANPTQRWLIAWFGVRGVGTLYYLMYLIQHGLPRDLAEQLTGLTLSVVVVSVIVHGISVTPLMSHYATKTERKNASRQPDAA